MNRSLKETLNNLSLKNQILLFALVPASVTVLVFLLISASGIRLNIAVTTIISLSILFLSYLGISYLANKFITMPGERIISTIKNFNNDLTVRIPVTGKNEFWEFAGWFNNHMDNIGEIIKRVSGTTDTIHSHTNKISEAVSEEATILAQQSAAVAEITSTTEELSASSTQIAEHAKSVVDVATKTWEDTKKGATSIETVIMKMNEISSDSQNTIDEIVELGKKSKEISKIMEIINHIADQTKLIAFNAALEASSAGESGKRFGVVAVEIRRLADSVMESTGEIEGKVNEIQESINRLVIASEKTSKVIREGVDSSTQTAAVLIDIVDAAQSTTDAAKQISLSTQQQKTANDQVVVALKEIVAGSGQTTHSINQISSIGKEIVGLSNNLNDHIKNLKFNKKPERGANG
jgi:methyl-accepting chemotaxis protein